MNAWNVPLRFAARVSLGIVLACAASLARADDIELLDPNFASPDPEGALVWYDAVALGVLNRGWDDVAAPYDRLPARAEAVAPPSVWSLSRESAGLTIRFRSDSSELAARWSLTKESLAMPHMPATGVSGLDLYARDGGRWRWAAGARPEQQKGNQAQLAGGIPGGMHEYLLYLPLYNGVEKLEIGIRADARLARAEASEKRPIVFYGTSITQGGCAARPGMAYPALLQRRLGRGAINLGFSGNGRMEPAMAELIAELDPAVFVLDCLPNMTPELVTERIAPFVRRLREAHPDTPILLVENITYQRTWFVAGDGGHVSKNRALRKEYEALVAEGVTGLRYLPGDDLLGDDNLGTVDGTHPTDVGFLRMADTMEPVLRELLGE